MEAHNGKTRLGSSDVPLVVKFADAKRRDQQLQVVNPYGAAIGYPDPGVAYQVTLPSNHHVARSYTNIYRVYQ